MKKSDYGSDIDRRRLLRALIYGLVFAIGGCTIVLLVAAIIISKNDVPQNSVNIIADVAVILSSFMAGIAAARVMKCKGLVTGASIGIIYYIIMFLSSILFFKAEITIAALTKLIMMVVSSSIGGIIGVNFKLRKRI